MPLVDAALAFAITMLAVATVVTKLVDFLHWLLQNGPALLAAVLRQWLGERATLFKQMVDEFVHKELTPIAVRELNLTPDQARAAVEQAVQQIKQRVPSGAALIHMSNAALLDHLKQTDLGKRIAALEDRSTLVFDEISRRYESIEAKFTDIFRKNSRQVAIAVSLIVALAFNIDCVNILESYIHNPALSATIAATSDKALADFTAQMADKPGAPTAEELTKQYEARQKSLNELNSAGFPFGWSYFPYGPTPPRSWIRTVTLGDSQPWRSSLTVWATWVIGIAFTVGMAGLGAPFWYDVIRKLVQMTRGGSAPADVKTVTAKGDANAADGSPLQGNAPAAAPA
jgi:hypothetical protein